VEALMPPTTKVRSFCEDRMDCPSFALLIQPGGMSPTEWDCNTPRGYVKEPEV